MNDDRVETMRRALIALPEGTSHGDAPSPGDIYLPRSHVRAMDPDHLLVSGMRGAGKTFWWSALQKSNVRKLIASRESRSTVSEETVVKTGFGVTPAPDAYPSKDVLKNLMNRGAAPRIIWRTVQAHQLAGNSHPIRKRDSWRERVKFVQEEPEHIERLFEQSDQKFDAQGVYCLILFDALDRCADEWRDMHQSIRGLLQTALEMRSYRRLRVKVFLRSDQISETEIGDFPDASKVFSSAVELSWPRHELYGLLWHYLANGESGAMFRKFLGRTEWAPRRVGNQRLFSVPRRLVSDEEQQRVKFHELAGEWMGRDRRRGFPYTWIPNHLGDTEGRVSPRSFLAALRAAAHDTENHRLDHGNALHYESIKRGVQEASKIRVREIQEDYPWVHRILGPLKGMVVPCEFDEIAERWKSGGDLERLAEEIKQDEVKLPPRHMVQGAEGVREDLESLGIFFRLRDGRVNIPDVFRVGYGLGRRGGVRPIP